MDDKNHAMLEEYLNERSFLARFTFSFFCKSSGLDIIGLLHAKNIVSFGISLEINRLIN